MSDSVRTRRMTGLGTVLVFVYGVMALAATGRSFVQIVERFADAPLAYLLSAAAAVVYVLATIALMISKSVVWYRIAWVAVCFELAGVLIVGTLSWAVPDIFHAEASVWTHYGSGYVWIPLVLPFLGIWWLATHRPAERAA